MTVCNISVGFNVIIHDLFNLSNDHAHTFRYQEILPRKGQSNNPLGQIPQLTKHVMQYYSYESAIIHPRDLLVNPLVHAVALKGRLKQCYSYALLDAALIVFLVAVRSAFPASKVLRTNWDLLNKCNNHRDIN